MKKYFKYFLFVFVFISIVFFLSWLGRSPDPFINDIENGFRGRIIDKYFLKTTHLVIKRNGGQVLDVSSLSSKLIEQSKIGDSIVKYQDRNCCMIIDDSMKIVQYLFVPEKILNDKRWKRNASHLELNCP